MFAAAESSGKKSWRVFFAATGLLLLLIPPNGALSGNEEYYLSVALQFWNPAALPKDTVLFGGMPHALLFGGLLGPIVDVWGFPAAQIIGRSLVVLLYAAALTRLWRVAGLGVLELIIVLLGFSAADQMLFANEWMFHFVEAKVFAYALTLVAIADYLEGRLRRCFVLLAAATWFHFLAGGLWAGLIAVALWLKRPSLREWLSPVLIFAALVAPLLIYLVTMGYASQGVAHAKPTPAWIYSFVAMPAHSMPSKDLERLLDWLPGMGATLALFVAALRAPVVELIDKKLTLLVTVASGYLLLMIVITYADGSGTLGPYLVFRPASLTLFLALMVGVSLLRSIATPLGPWLRGGMAFFLFAATVPTLLYAGFHAERNQAFVQKTHNKIVSYIREHTPAESRFLMVEIATEERFYDFERTTGRALLVMYRYVPARADELIEWHRRHQFRTQIRQHGCSADGRYSPDYLLASVERARGLASTCGPIVFQDGSLALIHYEPTR